MGGEEPLSRLDGTRAGNPPPSRGKSTTSVAEEPRQVEAAQPGTERNIEAEYSTEVAELLTEMQPTFALWREREDNALLTVAAQVLPAMIADLAASVGAEWGTLLEGDARAVGRAAQRAVQRAGTAFILAAWQVQGHAAVPVDPEERPCCSACGNKMKLVRASQPRRLVGRLGTYELARPYYTCPQGHGGFCPADEAWGLGAGTLDPDLLEVVAGDGVESDFEQAREAVFRHLQVSVDDNTVERVTVGMGHVVRRQNERRAAVEARPLPPDPGSDIVLIEVDGGRVHAGGEWREVKVAAAGPLPPAKVVDKDTGRVHLSTGPLHYAADITDADSFFAQGVRQVAENAGLFHPRVRTVVQLSDGGEWIENRWASLGLPASVEVVDILDFRHLQQHIWAAAKASWGDGSSRTKTWSKKQIDTVLGQGPQPLLDELARIRPRRPEGREEMRKLGEYVSRNAHRLHYPEFIARELPMGSGAIEAGVRVVNNERLKNACMHWSVAGARAVLALRAVALSPLRCWQAFWADRPWMERPSTRDLAPLRKVA